MSKRKIIFSSFFLLMIILSGCSFSEKATKLKDDVVNITKDQIAVQLENSLNQEFPGVQLNVPAVTDSKGNLDWDALQDTELGNYVFYSFGDYEFRAVLTGDGVFKIERKNYATNETYSYAEFDVTWEDGKFQVTVK